MAGDNDSVVRALASDCTVFELRNRGQTRWQSKTEGVKTEGVESNNI